MLASGGHDSKIRLWDVDTETPRQVLSGHAGPVQTLAFSPDGRTLASTSTEMKLWQTATGRELATLAAPGAVFCAAWSPRGQVLAGGGSLDLRHGAITLWNAALIEK
jgi:WD40 repeat protein